MKKMLTVLVTAALFTTIATPTYAACQQNTAAKPTTNCPNTKCSIQNILPGNAQGTTQGTTQGNNCLPQLPRKNCNWNAILDNLIKPGNNGVTPDNTIKPEENNTQNGNCNNQNKPCGNGNCSNSNQNQDQNQNCTTGNCNNQTPTNPTPDQNQNGQNNPSGYAAQVVSLVNAERAKEGLSPLKADSNLSAAAQVRSQEIVSAFSHTRPNGSSCFTVLKEMGIAYQGAGENIAYGQKTPEEVVSAWMKSEGHRANIMNKQFTSIGIGYHTVGNTAYWTQLFTY